MFKSLITSIIGGIFFFCFRMWAPSQPAGTTCFPLDSLRTWATLVVFFMCVKWLSHWTLLIVLETNDEIITKRSFTINRCNQRFIYLCLIPVAFVLLAPLCPLKIVVAPRWGVPSLVTPDRHLFFCNRQCLCWLSDDKKNKKKQLYPPWVTNHGEQTLVLKRRSKISTIRPTHRTFSLEVVPICIIPPDFTKVFWQKHPHVLLEIPIPHSMYIYKYLALSPPFSFDCSRKIFHIHLNQEEQTKDWNRSFELWQPSFINIVSILSQLKSCSNEKILRASSFKREPLSRAVKQMWQSQRRPFSLGPRKVPAGMVWWTIQGQLWPRDAPLNHALIYHPACLY